MEFYQVDSFTDNIFTGNPAGVCLLEDAWLDESLMQNIAMEINLSETVFVLKKQNKYFLRWFTPICEVPLCGHATLAAAHILYSHKGIIGDIEFESNLHKLRVSCELDMYILDFPIAKIWQTDNAPVCFDILPIKTFQSTDEYLYIYEKEQQIKNIKCNMQKISEIDLSGIIITAKSDEKGIDFVSRYFAPKIGINEDPVTGSAHTLLVPYWQSIFNKNILNARQISKRGGRLYLEAKGDRIFIGGYAKTFLQGAISL